MRRDSQLTARLADRRQNSPGGAGREVSVRILRRDQEFHDISSQGLLYLPVVVIVVLIFALSGLRNWVGGTSTTPASTHTESVFRSP